MNLNGKTKIGPFWRKHQATRKVLLPQFESLLTYNFDALIPGHGTPLISGAKESLRKNIHQQLVIEKSRSKL